MDLTRRAMMTSLAVGALAPPVLANDRKGKERLGLVIHSFAVRGAGDRGREAGERFDEPIRFLDYCKGLGAGSVQVGIGSKPDEYAERLRERAEAAGVALEGIVSLPRDEGDLPRFEAEVRTARRAGVTIARTVMLSGRRYETFGSLADFRTFADRAARSLALAAPVAKRIGVRLAVENHKDWRADELIRVLKPHEGDGVGVCLDTGNSIALLEDPTAVVEALAPLTLTTHFKDMGVQEYPGGFLLAEVPLGAGGLDLARWLAIIKGARPETRINLEMITRDPLEVPCLTDRYWATFPDLSGRELARSLAFVRAHPPRSPLPRVSGLDPAARLRAEDENLRRSFDHAHDRLGL